MSPRSENSRRGVGLSDLSLNESIKFGVFFIVDQFTDELAGVMSKLSTYVAHPVACKKHDRDGKYLKVHTFSL